MSEWNKYKLGEVGTFNNGVNKSKNSFGHGYPFVNLLDIFDKDTINQIPKGLVDVNQDELNRYNLRDGDILFVRSSVKLDGVGKVCVITKDLENTIYSGFIIRYRQSELIIDKLFASYYLNSAPIRKKIIAKATLSANSNINQVSLKTIPIRIPSLPTQRHIARILSTCDAVIEKTQAAIDKYKAIKQGMLHDLFTRGIDTTTGTLRPKYEDTPELYKESKLGLIPLEWQVETLEKLTDKIGSGITPTGGSEIYKTSGILFIRSQNVLVGSLSIDDAAYITSEIDEMMQATRVKPFDVLLNITGASIGRCAFFPEELKTANVNQHVCIIRFIDASKALAVFASEFINSSFGQKQINRANAGGNRDGLNFQQIKSFSFPEIHSAELERMSNIIETISNKLRTEQNYLHKLQSIKQGLMADLLSGRKRVSVPEELTLSEN